MHTIRLSRNSTFSLAKRVCRIIRNRPADLFGRSELVVHIFSMHVAVKLSGDDFVFFCFINKETKV